MLVRFDMSPPAAPAAYNSGSTLMLPNMSVRLRRGVVNGLKDRVGHFENPGSSTHASSSMRQ